MSYCDPKLHPRTATRRRLLAGVSVSALAVGAATPASAGGAAPPLSQAWFAARVDASTSAGAAAGSASGQLSQMTTATQNLATIATRLQAMEAAQAAAAHAASTAATSVANGTAPGGLVIAPNVTIGSSAWSGATGPVQTAAANGLTNVTVTQTAPQALLTWQTFNVGSKTALSFNQSAGGSNAASWVVLNRVEDPAAQPSQILGSITAPGKVYIINANGIVFGAGSQINLGSLIASTADISNTQFATGIYGAQSGSSFAPTFTGALPGSSVIVDQGAQITTTTPSSVTAAGGYVMLLGGAVENDGMIQTPGGQTVLAAGQDFILRAGYSTTGNLTATVQGSQVAVNGKAGVATNNGVIISTLGDVTIAGHDVTQAGAVVSTTSVNTRGTVHLLTALNDGGADITLAPGSITVVNPDNAATTALDSQRASLIAQSAVNNAARLQGASATNPLLNDVGQLSDLLDESRIEITTGGTVAFDSASLTMTQGGQIAVQAGARAWAGDGAMLDVSGSTGAVLPASSTILTVNIQGNELRDAPVNRDTGLISSTNVSLDIADLVQVAASSSDPNARDYTQGGLLEVSGYLANIGHTIDEWAAVGGTITLSGHSVISQPQSVFNLAGGAVTVQGGEVAQSYLIGPGGVLYNANTAPANILYTGVYNGFTVGYQRFGGSDTYASSVATPTQLFQNGYYYGRDAGSLVVSAPTAVLEGQIQAGVTNGAKQIAARPGTISDPYTLSQATIAEPGTLAITGFDTAGNLFNSSITISDAYTPVADQIGAGGTLPAGVANTVQLSASQISGENLGGFSAVTAGTIDVAGPLALAPGGTLSLASATTTIAAGLTARGGKISISDLVDDPAKGAIQQLTPLNGSSGGGVIIAQGVTIDLRGEWTNAVLDPANVSGEGLINGGALAIDSLRTLQLAAGSVIDASSGGALLAGNKPSGGTGGSVTLTGDDPFYGSATNLVIIDSVLRDAGVNGGGTLSITGPNFQIGAATGAIAANTQILDPATFRTGFSDYVVNGFKSVTVAAQTAVTVAEPVYTFYNSVTGVPFGLPSGAPTGEDPSAVFQLILPPAYLPNQATARLTQRRGASVAFISNNRPGLADFGGGAIDLGAGSSITVDPGQSVRIEAYGQITDDAAISAPGGSVALINEEQNILAPHTPVTHAESLSVWIGGDATIDVAGLAATALDASGRPFGVITAGGSITLGAAPTLNADGSANSTDALVIIRPGAVLDASGAAATIDLLAGTTPNLAAQQTSAATTDPVQVASSGGAITLDSNAGIYNDGTLRAAAGGAGAAGGTLSMTLEAPLYPVGAVLPGALNAPRLLTISQDAIASGLSSDLTAGEAVSAHALGQASISQQQLSAGGFGAVALFARDAFVFNGDVALDLPLSVTLSQGAITDNSKTAQVTVTAPYVKLNGQTGLLINGVAESGAANAWEPYAHGGTGSFTVSADLIDIVNAVHFGEGQQKQAQGGGGTPEKRLSRPGFAQITLDSSGDIRFDQSTVTGQPTSLTTPGNLTLQAAQVYPTTGAVANVYAGYDQYHGHKNVFTKTGTITILGNGATPAVPYSIGGTLNLYAGSIVQGGVLRAPEGTLSLGGSGVGPAGSGTPTNNYTYTVTLLPGSVTSVSLDGATVPYGGTVDGVTYDYNGIPVSIPNPSVTLAGQVQTVDAGALLDLSGGGTLAGAGFITGRGGSTNVLTNPFLVFSGSAVTAPTLSQDPVYAILPGYQSGYAPTSPVETSGSYGAVPAIGSQITIGAGVPGVAPGTYTLLPAYYALLPGAARVQINRGTYDSVPGVTALGADSYALNAVTSTANAAVAAALPVEVIVTTEQGVTLNSQYNQESYSQFALAQAAQFGRPRGALPEDGKTLNLIFPAQAATVTALNFAGTALFDAQAAPAGSPAYFAGQASVGGVLGSGATALEITADGATPSAGVVSIAASALDAIAAPRLLIGGQLQASPNIANQLQFLGTAGQVTIDDGAVLRAPEVFLISTSSGARGTNPGAITLASGATIDTVGQGAPPYDSTAGYYYNANGYSVVAVSNGQLNFTPTAATSTAGAITIADGASLFTQGTLTFVTDKNLSLGVAANYGARYFSIDVNNINIVSDAALAAANASPTPQLPAGFTLTQDVLAALLNGNPAFGTPALQSLTLTAAQSVNFGGTVALDASSLQSFVLNTPAIYGLGGSSDTATITSNTFYWNGIEAATPLGNLTTPGSATPGAAIMGGAGYGTGTLDITAQNIVLGYGPNTQPDDQTTLNRLIEGFSTVNLNASVSLSANNRGTLSVYEIPGALPGAAGTGGDLNITTPLITGAPGSIDGVTAGGALTLAAPEGVAPSTATSGALGAELDLSAGTIADSTAVLLNSGRLTMNATTGDVTLGAGARVDLAGAAVTLIDQTEYSGGGSVVLSAAAGGISTDAASSIDVSAIKAAAGSIEVTALAGTVDLQGAIAGGAAGGGADGSFTLRAGSLPNTPPAKDTVSGFDALNTVLDAGSVFGSRSFEIATGDITVDHTVQAHDVTITADAGALDVSGTIDASGAAPGAITLAGGSGLTIESTAQLDAQGTVLQADSTGAAIAAENRAIVSLTAAAGTLTLDGATPSHPGATINVSSPDPVAQGEVLLTAPRLLDSNGGETGEVAISAPNPVNILGAQTIALYGSRTYTPTDANGTIEQHADPSITGAISLDQLNADNAEFIKDASGSLTLKANTAGLTGYQLRPADIIESSGASGGNLTVSGDLDLSTMRYGPAAGSAPGAGIAGALTLRAADNLTVNGSISDGFATPPDASAPTSDDNGWRLYANEPLGQAVTLPVDVYKPIVLAKGTYFLTSNPVALNFGITIRGATLNAGVPIPQGAMNAVTAQAYTIGAGGFTSTGFITDSSGGPIARPGQVLPAGTLIPVNSIFLPGASLPFNVRFAPGMYWPAGAKLSLFYSTQVTLYLPGQDTFTLPGGAYIPMGSNLVFENGRSNVLVRPEADGEQGLIYATASLLPPGSQSWSLNLVAGANLASANLLAVQPVSSLSNAAPAVTDPAGSIVLADTHYTEPTSFSPSASFSVVRTGTGSLNLVAGGNVDEASLFGVYTAGTQTELGQGQDVQFNPARAQNGTSVLGNGYAPYNAVIATQQASYPDGGGDVLVSAQNDVLGYTLSSQSVGYGNSTGSVGDWLWRQGGSGIGQSTSWWINFGSYVIPLDPNGSAEGAPILAGFTGIGALGGGNVTVQAGADAGEVALVNGPVISISQGLQIADASTGRVTSVTGSAGAITGGATTLTGGGAVTINVAGTINPADEAFASTASDLGGTVTDMRGDIDVQAGQVGRINIDYGVTNATDPRPQDPFTSEFATPENGLIVVPGDGTVTIDARRDLVLAGAGDATREAEQALTAISAAYAPPKGRLTLAGYTGFSLWTPNTAITLFSAGGNLTPTTAAADGTVGLVVNDSPTDFREIYPATLDATAASGNLYYGAANRPSVNDYSLELAPSPVGQLNFLAAQSIYGNGYAVDMSGAPNDLNALPTQYNPSYTDDQNRPFAAGVITNYLPANGNVQNPNALFTFEADTPTGDLHAGDAAPIRFYAAAGDLVNVQSGEILSYGLSANEPVPTWYLAAKPVWMEAGQDIVSGGALPDPNVYPFTGFAPSVATITPDLRETPSGALSSGSVALNQGTTNISVLSAGRDILGSYAYVAGPGLLEIDAGRNINETGANGLAFGVFKSVGPVIDVSAANRSSGAGISIIDGAGSAGPDYSAFATLYFNNANQADLSIPLSAPANAGKVQQTYQDQLYAWLQSLYGYTGSEADALAFYFTLPVTQQDVFARSVFFSELLASGRQESDSTSLFYRSYQRGRTAIATLFPGADAAGNPIAYNGNVTMDSGSLTFQTANGIYSTNFDAGIATLNGGTIQVLTPGGGDTFGIAGGPAPGASSGVITQGSGNIAIYALDSVLLGQSRIFTTFGGNIQIWSAQGDINAGRGSKTTTILPPPLIAYDAYGDISLSPPTPTSGAGIATLAPIAGTVPGDVDLVAPLGTVDAGEAGIRVSGSLNIAALVVSGAGNITVAGKQSGTGAPTSTNTAAASAAAAAAGSSTTAATNSAQQNTQQPLQPQPSIITVEVIGDDTSDRRRPAA